MKKFLTPLAFLAFIALTLSYGEVKAESQLKLISADSLLKDKKDADPALAHAILKNVSSSNMSVRVSIAALELDENHHYSLCAGGLCGPPQYGDYTSTNPMTIAAGASTGDLDFEFKYYPYKYDENYDKTESTDGVSKFRFSFTDVNNAENAVSYEATFTIGEKGIHEILADGATLGPNPSRGLVRFSLAHNEAVGGEMKIYDSNGRPVKTFAISSATFNADLSDLANGAYFYAFKAGEKYFGGNFVIEK